MKTFLYIILGFALINTSPLLADSPKQPVQQTTDDTTTNTATPATNDDC